MALRHLLSAAASATAVTACAVVIVGMAHSGAATNGPTATAVAATSVTSGPDQPVLPQWSHPPDTQTSSSGPALPRPASTTLTAPPSAGLASTPITPAGPTATAAAATGIAAPRPTAAPPAPAALVRGGDLPVGGSTSGATEVITVLAASTSSHTATLQAWNRAPGGGWLRVGPAILAHVGSDGLSTAPSETRSATPIGSFTLTQSFGALGNPGTGLAYFQTTLADWWISQEGPLYNTHQHCSGSCGFTQGSPNEQLSTETPYYNYAVVMDVNYSNTGHSVAGAGSAFFLHVTDGTATAGCVAIPQSNLVTIMRWLTPSAHPRILIGVS